MNILVSSCEHVVNNVHELHDPLIKMKILQTLEKVRVLSSIRADHRDLFRFGLGRQDSYLEVK